MRKHTLPAAAIATAAVLAACQGQPAAPAPGASAAPTLQAIKQIPVGKGPHGMWAASGFVYNSDTGENRMSVIDPATDTVVATIPFPDGTPGYVKPFNDGKHVLVTDTKKGELVVIDPAQGHKIVQTIPVGSGPDKIRVAEDDKQVIVTLTNESKAVLLTFDADRTKAPARKDFAVGSVAGGEFKHRDAAFAGGWVVNPNSGENNVSLIEVGTGAVTTVSGGNNPAPVAIGMSGGKATVAIVGNAASNTISFFDLPGGAATTISDVGLSPSNSEVDSPLGRAFITMAGSNEVAVLDYVGKKLVGKVAVGKRPVHIYLAPPMPGTAVSHEVFVGNDDGESVTVFDAETLRVKATVMTDKGHHKMAFVGTKAYISNIAANNVSVIDRTQLK